MLFPWRTEYFSIGCGTPQLIKRSLLSSSLHLVNGVSWVTSTEALSRYVHTTINSVLECLKRMDFRVSISKIFSNAQCLKIFRQSTLVQTYVYVQFCLLFLFNINSSVTLVKSNLLIKCSQYSKVLKYSDVLDLKHFADYFLQFSVLEKTFH